MNQRKCLALLSLAAATFSLNTFAVAAPSATSPVVRSVPNVPPSTKESRFSRGAESELKFQEGLLQYQQGRLGEAEASFGNLVKTDPGDAEAYYYLGLSQLDQNKPGEALANFNQALRIDSTFDEVRAARATAEIRVGQYAEADTDLTTLDADPKWKSLVAYDRGQAAYQKGDLEAAATYFAKAKALGGKEQEPAGFYEGLTYIRMRELVRARTVFRETTLAPDRDPTVLAASRQLDNVLAAQSPNQKRFEAQLTLSYEYDSNVVQIGSDIPTPAGISRSSDWRFVAQPRGSVSVYKQGPFEFGIEASGYFTWHHELTDFDVASYQAGPYVNYKIADNLYASARYAFNYIDLGHDPYLIRHIVTPQLTYIEPKFGYTSGFVQFQERQFKQPNFSAAFDRDGEIYAIGVVQGITLPEIFRGSGPSNLELAYRFQHEDTEGSDFDSNGNSLGATLYLPTPLWHIRADIGVNANYDDYEHANSLDANGDSRQDFEFSVAAGLTKEFNKNFAVRVDYSYTDHLSNVETTNNLAPYEYDRQQLGVRLILTY